MDIAHVLEQFHKQPIKARETVLQVLTAEEGWA